MTYYLPENLLTNEDLKKDFPEWNVDEMHQSTGVYSRHISLPDETPSDLAYKAAERLFSENNFDRNTIDFILFCTQSNDYITPTTACVLQNRLCIPVSAGAVDINQGCSGFLYGLALADGLIKAGTAKNILLLTAETSSRYINKKDKSCRFLFGDGASAAIISDVPGKLLLNVGKFVLGTDGKGYQNIIIKYGGARQSLSDAPPEEIKDEYGNIRTASDFYMNGNAVFLFSINTGPKLVIQTLEKSGLGINDIDYFVLHQANKIILETIRKRLCVPEDKVIIDIETTGNTVSSSVPIVLSNLCKRINLKKGNKILIAAFGVGYSWGATVLEVE